MCIELLVGVGWWQRIDVTSHCDGQQVQQQHEALQYQQVNSAANVLIAY